MRKEKEAEREAEDLTKLQERAGLLTYNILLLFNCRKRPERVDWIYAGSSVSSNSLAEEFLLGKRRFNDSRKDNLETESMAKIITGKPKSQTTADNPTLTPREMEMKLREDPLFTIKKKEKEVVDEILRNPLRKAQYQATTSSRPTRSSQNVYPDVGEDRHRYHRQRARENPATNEYRQRRESRSRSPERRRHRDSRPLKK